METSRYRILIVDDDPAITSLLASFLGFQGYLCETATNGKVALEVASHYHFDVVMTDILMPEMDGITLTKTLLRQFPNLLIMVMSGRCDETSMESAVAAGGHDFIKKPFTLEEFNIRLQQMIEKSGRSYE